MRYYQKSARQLSAVILTVLITFLAFVIVAFGQSGANSIFLPLVSNGGIPNIATNVPIVTPTATQIATGVPATPLPTSTATLISTAPPTSAETPTTTATATPLPTLTSTPTATATETATPTDVPLPDAYILSNDTWFIDVAGGLHIIGEIKNLGSSNIQSAKITANIFNASNQVIAVSYAYTFLLVVPPGHPACFHIAMSVPNNWSYYELEGVYAYGGVFSSSLSILESTGGNNASGVPEILGQVQNKGTTRIESVRAIGSLFDPNGNIVGCNTNYVSSVFLDPMQISSFKVEFFPRAYPSISSYNIIVQGEPE